ncbi:MAG: hypothetical protein U9N76_08260, partial [Candidatus Marinimicrobia bacterium]|nr:hypothetical protein [Candidatus Neomarinimicrobiota bacterium]
IKIANQESGFIGIWEMNDNGEKSYFKFSLPDVLEIGSSNYSSESKWIYDKKNSAIILLVDNRMLKGSNKISKITSKEIELENKSGKIKFKKVTTNDTNDTNYRNKKVTTNDTNGTNYRNKKVKANATKIEKLDFTKEAIEELLNKKYADGNIYDELYKTDISWLTNGAKINYLKNINFLKYKHSIPIANFGIFSTEELITKVSYDENDNKVQFENIFGRIQTRYNEEDNIFFPLENLDLYNVVSEKTVKVPAGTFTCKVIESQDSDKKIRYYMINNRPGIYAKIIIEKEEFGKTQYEMYELTEINSEYKKQNNSEAIGEWLLLTTNGSKSYNTTEFEIIDDGRLFVNNASGGTFDSWTSEKEKKVILLKLGGGKDIQKLNIKMLSNGKMKLENEEIQYLFTKWNNQLVEKNNKNSKLLGVWKITNEASVQCEALYFSDDNNFYEIGNIGSTLETSYPQPRGTWMHDAKNSTIIFESKDGQSSFVGEFQITKSDEKSLILNNNSIVFEKVEIGK